MSMPRYFVDYQTAAGLQKDDEGSELETFDEARVEAISTLALMAKFQLPRSEHSEFGISVRDEAGVCLYRATLTFHGERVA